MSLKKSIKSISVVSVLMLNAVFFISCSKDDHVTPVETPIIVDDPQGGYPIVQKEVAYKSTTIPNDVSNLVFYYDLSKPVELPALKDTVVVFLQGGPKHVNDTAGVHTVYDIVNDFTQGGYSFIGLQQAHYLNPTVFGSGRQFTAQNAAEVNNATFEMLERTIKWLKNANKTVIVFGHSNGSLVTQAYLTTGRTLSDFVIISATRMIAVPEIFTAYNSGLDFGYAEGGTKFVTNEVEDSKEPYFNVLSKLQLDNLKDYVTLLAGKPFLPRVVYLLGARDQALGVLTNVEKQYLADNKIPSLTISQAGGGHGIAPYGAPSAIAYFRQFK